MSETVRETATLGGGCFWCLEAVFESLQGVERVRSGFAGGAAAFVTYEEVCTGRTGHAEVVQITFDPEVIPYRALLEVFFSMHDPTTPDRQGADVGTQYRSIVLWHSPEQREVARATMDALAAEGHWKAPIVTQLVPYSGFVPAGAKHEGYYRRNASQPYCQLTIAPKLAKLRARYAKALRADVNT